VNAQTDPAVVEHADPARLARQSESVTSRSREAWTASGAEERAAWGRPIVCWRSSGGWVVCRARWSCVGYQTGADLQAIDPVRRRTLATRHRRRAPSQRETVPTTWTAVAQSSSAASPRPWSRLPASLSVMPTGNAKPETTRLQRPNGMLLSVPAVPPDEHAASLERPRRRRDDEPKIVPSPHPLYRQHRQAREPLDLQLAPVGPRTLGRNLRLPLSGRRGRPARPRGVLSACGRAEWFGGGCIGTAIRLMMPGPCRTSDNRYGV
jgi:hypothetical protein